MRTSKTQSDSRLVELAQAGDGEARDTLVLRNRPYAVKCASSAWRARRRCCGTLLDLDDLIQECVVAILRAIDKCDVTKLKDRDLRWYAKLRCRNAIEDALATVPLVAVPRSTMWHYLHGQLSERGTRDVEDCLRRKIGRRPDLAVDQRLGPVDEMRLKGE